MIKHTLKVLAIFTILLIFSACNKAVPLRNPNFEVQAKSINQVQTAIKKALQGRRWMILTESPSAIKAKYNRGSKYSATVMISYTRSNVNVKLLESENLLQETTPEGEIIHKTYDGWIRNLESDIYIELSHL